MKRKRKERDKKKSALVGYSIQCVDDKAYRKAMFAVNILKLSHDGGLFGFVVVTATLLRAKRSVRVES